MADNVTIDPRYSKYTNKEIERVLDSVATIDDAPTEGSDNPVKSGAVASALAGYPTKDEITELLEGKQDVMEEASEEDVRSIVKDWTPDADPEPEPEP
jgi:hypothetical protein